ncbi:MAG: xanthine dehydrogenase family protein molybdopterin-binding subunit, partial [Pseudomonadota bacterium]
MALDEFDSESRIFSAVGTRPVRPDGIDKVTGKAMFGADISAPGMLHGAILRSPHAHAVIKSIDTSAAEALSEVKAIVTRADFSDKVSRGNADVLENVMAGAKVLYDGHAVAAVAATSAHAAKKALKMIKVEYDVLPHVTDVDASMQDGAPIIRDNEIKVEGYSANVMSRSEFGHGDLDAGFSAADVVMEKSFKTAA